MMPMRRETQRGIGLGRGVLVLGLLAVGALALTFASAQEAAEPRKSPREAWDAVYITGKKVGHIQMQVEPVTARDGRELLRVQVTTTLTFQRRDDTATMKLRYGTIETYDGTVLRLDTRTLTGANEVRTYGDVIDGKMNLTLEGGGQRQSMELPWPKEVRGPYAAELSLSRDPLEPGQKRSVKTFIPVDNRIGITHLEAKDLEEIELGGGVMMTLLRVEGNVTDEQGKPLPGMQTTYWVDTGGQILKSFTDAFGGMVTYRTTRQGALASGGARLDLVEAQIVKIPQPITDPAGTRRILYRLKLEGNDPKEVFPSDRRQTLRQDNDGSYLLEVRTAGPEQGAPDSETVAEEYRRPNPLINSEDSRVRQLAQRATRGISDPWAKAVAIQGWVADNVREKNFEVAFATAKDVARNLAGDCTEHSVLTAAMCRASGVPARIVVGLVYAEDLDGFGFHMWNEVYVNRRWVALDSSFRQSDVDATHIKLNDSSLDGVSPYETFLDVVRVFNKLTLEPLEIR